MIHPLYTYIVKQLFSMQLSLPTKLSFFGWVVPFMLPFSLIAAFFLYNLWVDFSYLYLYSAFLICLVLFSMAKFNGHAYLDPIHLFPYGLDPFKRRALVFLTALGGLGMFLLVFFGVILGIHAANPLRDVSLLVLFYAAFMAFDTAMQEPSLRIKWIRIIYRYVYFFFLPFCFATTRFFPYNFDDSVAQAAFQLRTDAWYLENYALLLGGTAFVLACGIFSFFVLGSISQTRKPFIREFNDFNQFF
ncbi:MAG: hypothetical protein JJU34_16880 [Lunatimonas sp.]|uniref:hypothetical protein n=1 Tax=Lunatimonas sp. TaxID=2060141 RepID=UPI00263AFBB1|nr:hypothetical protein [Lunatimonas sp.]MCC5938955.1 hypothetical protein [Lunatimonas sp.]